MRSFFIPILTAIRFLTIFPVSWKNEKDGDYFPASLYFFPVVGAMIGILGFFLARILLI
ncbi:adenosylcobinamide-GDP ribazoletransferase, partial [Desulfomarina sp.]